MVFISVKIVPLAIVFRVIWGKKVILFRVVGSAKYVISVSGVKLECERLSFCSEIFKRG